MSNRVHFRLRTVRGKLPGAFPNVLGIVVDPIGSGYNGIPRSVSGSGFAIRIRIQEGKIDPQKYKKKLFFEVLDVLL
jgi:hypothetical protein